MRIDGTDGTKPRAAQAALEQRLRRACQDFEAVFLRHLLQKMRETLPKGGLLGQTRDEEIFRSLLDGALADEMAKSGDLGLGRMLYDQLSRAVLKDDSHPGPEPVGPRPTGRLKPDGNRAEDVTE